MVTSDFSPEVEIQPFRACLVHPDIIIGTVRFFLRHSVVLSPPMGDRLGVVVGLMGSEDPADSAF